MITGLLLGINEREKLKILRELAEANPVALARVRALSETETFDKGAGLYPFPDQTVDLPLNYRVTFTIDQQEHMSCRHLSVSVSNKGRLPTPEAVALLMEELGFINDLRRCFVYPEEFDPGHNAINVVEPVSGNMRDILRTEGQ